MKTSLELFTNPRHLSEVSHRQVATLIDHLIQLFPGKYVLPNGSTDNDGFLQVLAENLTDPEDLPAAFLKALEEIEALASPENVPNLNIPQNVDPQDPESKPLYHAISDPATAPNLNRCTRSAPPKTNQTNHPPFDPV